MPSLAVLAREIFQTAPRTVKNRLSMQRIFTASPALERAYLEGGLSSCQVLALRPLFDRKREESEIEDWMRRAEGLSVRELQEQVREALRAESSEDPDEEVASEDRSFEFWAPVEFRVVDEQMSDLARRVLGFDAPRARCLEAILIEGKPPEALKKEDPEPEEASAGGKERPGIRGGRGGRAAPPPRPTAIARADATLRHAEGLLASAHRLFHAPEALRDARALADRFSDGKAMGEAREGTPQEGPSDAFAALDRLLDLQRRRRPLQRLLGQIVARLQETGTDPRLASLALGVCPRTLRDLARDAHVLDDCPLLAQAYRLRVLGKAQIQIIHRLARTGEHQQLFLARARETTFQQFAREAALLERLRHAGRGLAVRFPGPLPMPGLEEALVEQLEERGWTKEGLSIRLSDRRIAPLGSSASGDPAEDADAMRRLETLSEMLLLAEWDEPPKPGSGLPATVRKTFAPARVMPVRWMLPETLAEVLQAALKTAKEGSLVPLPTWAALVTIYASASEVWEATDPERRPVARRILERDEYRCQAPGCTARSRLVVHHIEFRSRGGCNLSWNLITLCHVCHEHLIHRGRTRLRGRAPGELTWSIGRRRGRRPLMILRGSRIVERNGV